MKTDVLVIGGGPAGLSAAVNVRARGKSVRVVSNPPEESSLWRAARIDNHLGMPGMSGAALLTAFRRHAEEAGALFAEGRALTAAWMGQEWYLSVGSEMYAAGALVLACGVVRGKKYPGEERFLGRGVSYCATCDGMLYRGRNVVVIGENESARKEADYLAGIGCRVTYRQKPRTCEISGQATVERVVCDGETLAADGVFILRPAIAPGELLPGLAVEGGFVTVDRTMAANLPGVFAAGDCTGGPLQLSKAVGEGLVAGQSAARWLDAQSK